VGSGAAKLADIVPKNAVTPQENRNRIARAIFCMWPSVRIDVFIRCVSILQAALPVSQFQALRLNWQVPGNLSRTGPLRPEWPRSVTNAGNLRRPEGFLACRSAICRKSAARRWVRLFRRGYFLYRVGTNE
tara:strand:+ start:43 stop:435 length:393 start_codon:yes stop_codon:yes gene_type:complete